MNIIGLGFAALVAGEYCLRLKPGAHLTGRLLFLVE
jgi:hypothetical protein